MIGDRTHEAQQRWHRAAILLQAGLPEAALRECQAANAQDPSNNQIALLEARIHVARNHGKAALRAISNMTEDAREWPDTQMVQATAFLQVGDVESARKLGDALGEMAPADPRPQQIRAAAAMLNNDADTLKQTLTNLHAIEPSRTETLRTLAYVSGETPNAYVDRFIDGSSVNTMSSAEVFAHARWLRHIGRHAEAQVCMQRLINERGDDPQVLFEAGLLTLETGGEDGIALLHRAARRMNFASPVMVLALGEANARFGHAIEAAKAFWRLSRLENDSADAWAGLAVAASAAGKFSLARRASSRLHFVAHRRDAQQKLARYRSLFDAADMFEAADQTIEERTHSATLMNLLYESIDRLSGHCRSYHNRADTHYHLAICRREVGDMLEAEAHLRAAVKINPRYDAAKRLARGMKLPIAA